MKWSATLSLLALAVAGCWLPQRMQAATAAIPARLYPAGAHVSYRPTLTNDQLDCMWGFFCEGGVPLYHLVTQDALRRTGGWGQFAGIRRGGRVTMAFELFASSYAPVGSDVPWSVQAFTDLRDAVVAQGYTLRRQPSRSLRVSKGGCLQAAEPGSGKDDEDLTVMACWSGDTEVEAIAMYRHGSASAGRTAVTDLVLQVSAAMRADESGAAGAKGS